MSHWAPQYIGKRWVSGARGPDTFDCWGLCWWIQKEHFARQMPIYALDPANRALCGRTIDGAAKGTEWRRILQPVEGCMVGLGKGSFLLHCGVYTSADGGLILHAEEGARVIAQTISTLRACGWQRIEFYQHISWQP
jgi:cell wall-associated NlpC family hydrolase